MIQTNRGKNTWHTYMIKRPVFKANIRIRNIWYADRKKRGNDDVWISLLTSRDMVDMKHKEGSLEIATQ